MIYIRLNGKSHVKLKDEKMKKATYLFVICICIGGPLIYSQGEDLSERIDTKTFNAGSVLWYDEPAEEWEEALPPAVPPERS